MSNWQRVSPLSIGPAKSVLCIYCNKFRVMEHVFANLDGVPFKDYCCDECAMINGFKVPDAAIGFNLSEL